MVATDIRGRNAIRQLIIVPLLLLAACSDDAPPVDKRASEAKQLKAGEYEVTAKVTSLASTDKSTPATKLKIGDSTRTKGCVGEDGTPAPALFVDVGDVCKVNSSYTSGAILNLQLTCTRKSNPGYVTSAVDGSFTADAFKATVTTGTSFYGNGDYQMVRELTGKRVGVCTAPAAKAG
ncbi:MAG: DUF3617 domain-containing protein [Sphingomonadales bacterium]|nr:DUF3617 domain-containing protein [Sphingomonadales bacterium]